MQRFGLAFFCLSMGLSLAVAQACTSTMDDCSNTSTCAAGGEGPEPGSSSAGSGGDSSAGGPSHGEGGEPDGGTGGDSGGASAATGGAGAAGEAGAGGAAQPCDGACAAPQPVCDEPSDTCVECLEAGDCKAGPKNKCDTSAKECVACLESNDCTTAAAAKCEDGACVKCTSNDDCAHLPGKTVCDAAAGECVECTGKDYASCGADQGIPLVCDSLKRICTTNKEHAADLCKACVSDANCKLGEACVLEKYDGKDAGYFCFWKQGDAAPGAPDDCFTDGKPYAAVQLHATSVDGATADICTLRSSTCLAVSQFSSKNCQPGATPDNTLCGLSPTKDAKCDQVGSSANYRCTMTCGSDEDCPGAFTCNTSTFVCDL